MARFNALVYNRETGETVSLNDATGDFVEQQVAALIDRSKPAPPPEPLFAPGDIVRFKNNPNSPLFVVVAQSVREALEAFYNDGIIAEEEVSIISLEDGASYSPLPDALEVAGAFVKVKL